MKIHFFVRKNGLSLKSIGSFHLFELQFMFH